MTRNRSPLLVGVVLEGTVIPAWGAWLIDAIRDHKDLELALAVVCVDTRRRRSSPLFTLYEALDRRVFRSLPDALQPVEVSRGLEGVRRIHALRDRVGTPLDDGDIAALRSCSLDVLVALGGGSAGGVPVSVARHGVWSFHFGDPLRYRGEPALFWELFFGDPASVSTLEMLAGGTSEPRVIYRSAAATDPVSLQRARNPVYWKSARFALRRLEDLATGRWTPKDAGAPIAVPSGRLTPSNSDTVRHAVKIAGRVARRRLRRTAFERQWFLGFRRRNRDTLPDEDRAPWQPALPPRDRYWADPFVFADRGEILVFMEQLRYDRGKGELAVGRMQPDGVLTDVEPILSAPHHLSYPYVFRDGGRKYLIPESAEARRVDLWTATDFPFGWERVATLLDGVNAVDASILRHAGLYWLWVNEAVPGGRLNDEAFLYFSDRLDSGWTPHPCNPVVSDARRARPAGRPFIHEGVVIRPAQDCTGRYGVGVVFNAVEMLTPDAYRERPVGRLGPAWVPTVGSAHGRIRNLCAHTYTFDGGWEATDGLRHFSRLRLS